MVRDFNPLGSRGGMIFVSLKPAYEFQNSESYMERPCPKRKQNLEERKEITC